MITKIAQIQCDDGDCFEVVTVDKQARCNFNKIPVIETKDLGCLAPVIGVLITSACHVPDSKIRIKGNPSYADFLREMLDTISKSDQAKIRVLEEKPDEITDNKPKEAKFEAKDLDGFRNNVKELYGCLDNTLSLSNVLLKTKLPKNVYSFKILDKTISRLKIASHELDEGKNFCEVASEQIDIKIGQILAAVSSNKLEDGLVRSTVKSAVEHMTSKFLSMKKCLASMIIDYYNLYAIDKTFKKHTGYPATWYFDPSAYYNFTESYKDASDNLIEATRLEASVLRPMQEWQTKL
jgi:hypothetical protein